MGLQVIWSFGLALMVAYALLRKKVLHNPIVVSLFAVGDWVKTTLSLASIGFVRRHHSVVLWRLGRL
ncbi:CASP-like protein 5b3 [Phtheirospermum japonicum]|uniref:CASP-like protein n=1 Tax=Phtheirospermum japonicum TaxID=374723 RepID=A0A830C8B0_9LAMI|nr:CASP-like protein 5b3 [Phtheirospermum japonicum]